MGAAKKFKMPLRLAACADLLYETKKRRLEIERDVADLKSQETQLKERLIAELPKGEATGIAGQVARVAVVMQLHAELKDAEAFRAYLIKTGRWDLAYATRVAEKAVKDMWEDGKTVPGVSPVETPFVSVTKV